MPEMQLDESLVKVYRTAPVDPATLDSEAVKGRVKVAVPQFDPQGELVKLEEEKIGNATVIRSPNDADAEKPYLWFSAAPERVQVPGNAAEEYGKYSVPYKTLGKIVGQEKANEVEKQRQGRELTYGEFIELSATLTYAELQGYLGTLEEALEAKNDSGWIVVMPKDAEVTNAEAVHQSLQEAPRDAGIVHLAGFNKYGGFGELPIRVGEGNAPIEGLVEPTRFYGGGMATAFRVDVLPAMISALKANLASEPKTVETENGTVTCGGVSPLDHVFALLQRSTALEVKPGEQHPEDKAVLDAFLNSGGKNKRIYAMNPAGVKHAGDSKDPALVKPVKRTMAGELREIVHRLQMGENGKGGNDEAIKALDPLIKCCVDAGAQRALPPEALKRSVTEIDGMAEHKEALKAVQGLIKERFDKPENGPDGERDPTVLNPGQLVDAIARIGQVAGQEDKVNAIKDAIASDSSAEELSDKLQELSPQSHVDAAPRRVAGGWSR